MTKMKHHVSASIEGLLRQRSLTWLEDDNGNPLTTKKAKSLLREELASGKKYIASGNCDNVDAEGRCLGHPDDTEPNA